MVDQTYVSQNELVSSWETFLWQKEIVQHYRSAFIEGIRSQPPRLLADQILPEMVYVRMLTILDDAFTYFIDENNLRLPKNCRTLHGKIKFLDKHKMLQNSNDVLNKIRKKRNKFGHDRAMGQLNANEELSWTEVDSSIDIVHNELQNILKIGTRPKYSITVERFAFEDSNEPGVVGAFRYTLTLTKDGKRKYEHKWSYKLLDD